MASFCPGCGNSMAVDDRFCRVCGKNVEGSALPSGTALPAIGTAETSGKAIASLICGFLFFFPPIAIVAVIFGHLALSEIRKSAGHLTGRGLAVAGLVMGYAGVSVIPILIIAAIAIPNLLRARMAANEASAVATLRALSTAEVSYSTLHPELGFTPVPSRSCTRRSLLTLASKAARKTDMPSSCSIAGQEILARVSQSSNSWPVRWR